MFDNDQVKEGSGKALVIAVGPNSEWGKTMQLMEDAGDDNTPLQDKLEVVAGIIGKIGLAVAVSCFIALMIKWMVYHKGFPIKEINHNGPVQFFIYMITIIVVAVPEGLPMAVTISLAYRSVVTCLC
jgi:Ca2+-transporting ATPase